MRKTTSRGSLSMHAGFSNPSSSAFRSGPIIATEASTTMRFNGVVAALVSEDEDDIG